MMRAKKVYPIIRDMHTAWRETIDLHEGVEDKIIQLVDQLQREESNKIEEEEEKEFGEMGHIEGTERTAGGTWKIAGAEGEEGGEGGDGSGSNEGLNMMEDAQARRDARVAEQERREAEGINSQGGVLGAAADSGEQKQKAPAAVSASVKAEAAMAAMALGVDVDEEEEEETGGVVVMPMMGLDDSSDDSEGDEFDNTID